MISFKELKANFKKYIKFFKLLSRDKRIPWISKAILGLTLVYFFSPIDIIPDFIPVLGQLDDLIIVPGLAFLALRFIPKEIYDENHKKAFG